MQASIETEIIEGKAVALFIDQISLIQAANDKGLIVYAPCEPGRTKMTWHDPAAKIANIHTIAILKESL